MNTEAWVLSWMLLATIVGICILIPTIYYVRVERPRERRMEEEEKKEAERHHKEAILHDLDSKIQGVFHVELDTVHETTTQDEIVRIVNLLACQTAMACVKQEKYIRQGGDSDKYDHLPDGLKMEWLEARKLALQIVPDLADRLPHFSEFEPLKSYNAEHLLKKKAG
jgi:hypothetical protein